MKQKEETYSEKLKNPKWQKLRLQIFERDKWTCRCCGNTSKTLHAHHKHYFHGTEPWDYPPEALVTLCEDCHEIEFNRTEIERHLITTLRDRDFFVKDIIALSLLFKYMPITSSIPNILLATQKVLGNEKRQKDLVEKFLVDKQNKDDL